MCLQIDASGIKDALEPTPKGAQADLCGRFSYFGIFKKFPWTNPLFRVSLLSLYIVDFREGFERA